MKDKLMEIFDETAKKNINIYEPQLENTEYLIYPKVRNKEEFRISEQETRFLLAKTLEEKQIYYSIETPTKEVYSFSNNNNSKGMSAQSDLTIYNNRRERVINIELKAHNPSSESIEKDMEKLLREDVFGGWLHTFENINSKTIETLQGKLYKGIGKNKSNIKNPVGILFYIIVLKKKEVYYRFINSKNLKKITLDEFYKNWETKEI